MTFTRTMRIGVLGVALAVTGLLAFLSNHAARAGDGCPAKTLCVWQDNEGGGQLVKISSDGISNKLAKKMNNEASSVINNRNKRAYLYDGKNGKGTKVCLSPGAEIGDLGSFADFNDAASSSKNADSKKGCPI
jgi:hypothetical protein